MKFSFKIILFSLPVFFLFDCGKTSDSESSSGFTSGEDCDTEVVCIVRTVSGNTMDFAVKTYANVAVTVSIEPTLTNMTATKTLPYVASFDGGKQSSVFSISPTNANESFTYSYKFSWSFGKLNTTHDDTVNYRLPYSSSETHKLIQGYSGTFSHTDGLKYSVDFAMNEGTQVLASRAGTVIFVEESYSEGGVSESLKTKANRVTILHSDGTLGEYLHFQKDGVTVQRGDKVNAGDPIGKSGNTGYTSTPHLHFHVMRRLSVSTYETFATKFTTSSSTSTTLQQDQTY